MRKNEVSTTKKNNDKKVKEPYFTKEEKKAYGMQLLFTVIGAAATIGTGVATGVIVHKLTAPKQK